MIRRAFLRVETVRAIGLIYAVPVLAVFFGSIVSFAATNAGRVPLTRVDAASGKWNRDLPRREVATIDFACMEGFRKRSQSNAQLVVALGFDKLDGNGTPDSSGYRISAKVFNAVSIAGRFHRAVALNGTNAYVRIDGPAWPLRDFTYAAWVFPRVVSGWRGILEIQTPESRGVEVAISPGGYVEMWSSGRLVLRNGIPLRPLAWTHVAATRRERLITVFLNGVAHRAGQDSTVFDFGSCPGLIGVDADSGCAKKLNGFFNGAIDELRVYDCALSLGSIRKIMETPLNRNPI